MHPALSPFSPTFGPPDVFVPSPLSWPTLRPALSGAAPHLCRVSAVDDPAELSAERALVERAHAGDRDALGALLRKHGPRLYRSVLLPRLGSAATAEEALSRTYVKVLERFDQFSWQAVGVYPWLRVVALRVALDLLRSRKRELLFEPEHVERELDSAEREAREADALERHDLNCARERVGQLLLRINPRYADAIRMRILEERTREEAAAALGVSVATFDVVLHRAMAALRKALPDGGGEA
ncbi:MAG TPA: RNA polymerase sigma factor [Polyangiaceae bacterium]|nr:RNA polymerase sigma factor [Polyangiaceae bacterium]